MKGLVKFAYVVYYEHGCKFSPFDCLSGTSCYGVTHSAGQQAVLPVSEKVKITQMQPEGYHIGSDYEFVKRVL